MNEKIRQRIDVIQRGEVPEGYIRGKLGIAPSEWDGVDFTSLFSESSVYTDDLEKYPLYSLTIENGITAKTERYERSHLVKKENSYKVVRPNDYAYNPMNIRFGAVARHKGDTSVAVSGYYDIFTTVHISDLNFMDSFLTYDAMMAYYNKVSTGSLLEKQRVHFSQFLDFCLTLPSLEERAKIAEILTTQDKVIELKEKQIVEKQRQKKYLMQQLLTGKKRLKGFSSEWEVAKLKSVLKAGNKKPVEDTSKYKKITIKLNFGGIEYSKNNREMADTRPFYIRKSGELIIGKQNYFNGSAAIIDHEFDGGICSNAIMSFLAERAQMQYIYYYITQADFMNKREYLANGTGQKELSEKDFLDFEIMLPSIAEQVAIAEVLATAECEISLFQKDLEQERLKKKALMQLLLTGIVRVSA